MTAGGTKVNLISVEVRVCDTKFGMDINYFIIISGNARLHRKKSTHKIT